MVRQILGMAAVMISGGTLSLLVALSLSADSAQLEERSASETEELVVEQDPRSTVAEILELHKDHGSVLNGSTLEHIAPADSFATEISHVAGISVEPLQQLPDIAGLAETPVNALRSAASNHEQLANGFEQQFRYKEADKLRHLAAATRRLARELAGDQPEGGLSSRPVSGCR